MIKNLIFSLCLVFTSMLSLNAQDWELASDKEGIKVYTRESPGSSIKEFKAVTVFEANMLYLSDVIIHVEDYAKWYDHCKSVSIISKENDNSYTYYMEIDMPFPFSNRDVVSVIDRVIEEESILLSIKCKEGIMDPIEGIVRMTISEGSWSLSRISDNKTQAIHQFKGDPAGNIPGGIVNMFLVGGPINTINNLKEFIKE